MNDTIIQPGKVRIPISYADGPLAQPVTVTSQGQVIVVGGLTKVETLAGQIAGHLSTNIQINDLPSADIDTTVARFSVNMAKQILEESQNGQ